MGKIEIAGALIRGLFPAEELAQVEADPKKPSRPAAAQLDIPDMSAKVQLMRMLPNPQAAVRMYATCTRALQQAQMYHAC